MIFDSKDLDHETINFKNDTCPYNIICNYKSSYGYHISIDWEKPCDHMFLNGRSRVNIITKKLRVTLRLFKPQPAFYNI